MTKTKKQTKSKVKSKAISHCSLHKGTIILSIGVIVVSLLLLFSGQFNSYISTSVLSMPEHNPFDGTVAPVELVPDWVHLDAEKWSKPYSSLESSELVPLPFYDSNELKTSSDTLEWGNSAHNKIRNAKITFSVPYLGNYLLDGVENVGSHPAVDIKIPNNTPILAIANGIVTKTSAQSSGFGYHVVIQHNNFPTLENPDAKETIYSSYSHLNKIYVEQGDIVKKGEKIALSGQTGTATTPHLHFQIDNSSAPWHPYWPFDWQEISKAGLDFFSAVNKAYNIGKARSTTIHPMKYVQKYMDVSDSEITEENDDNESDDSINADSYIHDSSDESNTNTDNDETTDASTEINDTSDTEYEPEIIVEEVKDPPVLTFDFEVQDRYYLGQSSDFTILMIDQYGEPFKDGFTGDATVTSQAGNFTAQYAIFDALNFNSKGEFDNSLKNIKEGNDRLVLEYNGEKYFSKYFEIVDSSSSVTFSDVPDDHKYHQAIVYLVSEGVVNGYPDGRFKPNNAVSRVEALKFILEGIKESVSDGSLPFKDVNDEEWYAKYLYTAYKKGVIDGYPDGSFKPTNLVNKAEFYKILFNGMGVDINPVVTEPPFEDVAVDEWYAPYVAYAKELGLIEPSVKKLHPSVGMSRGEVAYAIYKLLMIMK